MTQATINAVDSWKMAHAFLDTLKGAASPFPPEQRHDLSHRLKTLLATCPGPSSGLARAILFDAFVSLYDPFEYETEELSRHIPVDCNTIVDVGTGTGRLLPRLRSRYPTAQLIGIEPESQRSRVARAKLLNVRDCRILASVTDLACESWQSFDVVLLSWVLFSVDDARLSQLLEHARHARVVVVSEPALNSEYNSIRFRAQPRARQDLAHRLERNDVALASTFGSHTGPSRELLIPYVFPDFKTARMLIKNSIEYWHDARVDDAVSGLLDSAIRSYSTRGGRVVLHESVRVRSFRSG